MSKWDAFNDAINFSEISAFEESTAHTSEKKDVPAGTYEAVVTDLRLGISKSGKPTFYTTFRILEGEYKNYRIFVNQQVKEAFQFAIVKKILVGLYPDIEDRYNFKSLDEFEALVNEVAAEVEDEYEYAITHTINKGGFSNVTIDEIFE